jgi:tetratricopeptide (TPR) repeat protein
MILLALSTWGTIHRSVLALEAGQEKLSAALPDPVEGNSLGFGDWILAELCALYALSGNWDKAHDFARLTIQARARESLPPISLTSWYETEALLRGGDADLARTEVENLAEFASNNLRYQLLMYRSRAVLARWDGDLIQAIAHLEKALALAREIGLPGEVWPVLGELGGLYAENEAPAKAKHAYHGSAAIILQLAETIDEEDMRAGFLAAGPVRSILETSEIV